MSADKSCNAHVALVTAIEILPVEVVVSLFPGRIVVREFTRLGNVIGLTVYTRIPRIRFVRRF